MDKTELLEYRKELYNNVELMLVDDFGTAYSHQYPASYLEEFVEYRYAHRLATCITTNLDAQGLKDAEATYPRIIDRLRDSKRFDRIFIDGQGMRG